MDQVLTGVIAKLYMYIRLQELSKITMPVVFNEPLSFLQRVVEYMEYSELVHKAAQCDDPLERMEVRGV